METSRYSTHNLFEPRSYRTYEEWKLSLAGETPTKAFSSYRTYEEWKLCFHNHPSGEPKRSYRTYEEWKPHDILQKVGDDMSSYRTYEEWKRNVRFTPGAIPNKFLPYL